jgi:hypothetical protein
MGFSTWPHRHDVDKIVFASIGALSLFLLQQVMWRKRPFAFKESIDGAKKCVDDCCTTPGAVSAAARVAHEQGSLREEEQDRALLQSTRLSAGFASDFIASDQIQRGRVAAVRSVCIPCIPCSPGFGVTKVPETGGASSSSAGVAATTTGGATAARAASRPAQNGHEKTRDHGLTAATATSMAHDCGHRLAAAASCGGQLIGWGNDEDFQLTAMAITGSGKGGTMDISGGEKDISTSRRVLPLPAPLTGLFGSLSGAVADVVGVSCGSRHTVAVTKAGLVFAWGK